MSSKAQSVNGSESEFEFIETPKAHTPSFEKFEECGVKTTAVRCVFFLSSALVRSATQDCSGNARNILLTRHSILQLRMPPFLQMEAATIISPIWRSSL